VALGLIFLWEFRSELRNLKFHQWHLLWRYLCFSHISGPHRIRSFEVALGLIFLWEFRSELRNLKFHQWHLLWPYLCFSHIAGNVTSPNQIIWSGTRAYFPMRIHIWTQKFGIPSVAPTMAIFAFQPHCGTIWTHQIRSFEVVWGVIFQGESESEVRNFKFSL
jgi:hypothetical protein